MMNKKVEEREFVFTSTRDSSDVVTVKATSLGKAWRKLRREKGNHVGKKDYIVSEDFF